MDPLFKETLGKAFTLFLGLAALAATAWGGYGLVSNIAWVMTTNGIEGKVLAYERGTAPQTWNPLIEFYPPGGVKITFVSKMVITSPDPARGSMVPLRYAPRNPQEAELSIFRFKWAPPMVFTTLGLAVFFVWWRRMAASWDAPKKRARAPLSDDAAPPRRATALDAPPALGKPRTSGVSSPRISGVHRAAAAGGAAPKAPVLDQPWEEPAPPVPEDGDEAWDRTVIKSDQPAPTADDAWDRTSVLPTKGRPPRKG